MPFPFPLQATIPLYLAPMAGVSESPFRQLCHEHGADVVVTEFLSAEGIRRENEATLHKLSFGAGERPIGVQIFGADPVAMGEAARFVSDVFQPEFIDINFGCPVKKVVRRNGGSGCLRDLDLVQRVIRAVSASTHLPVTCKIRSGWSEEMRDPVTIALRCQDAGARVIALHPRTRTQMYSGHARWDEIAAVVDAVDIPVLGNGDIKTAEDAVRMREQTGCAGIMIARGSYGQPWIFHQVKDLLAGRPKRPAPTVATSGMVARPTKPILEGRQSSFASISAGTRKACTGEPNSGRSSTPSPRSARSREFLPTTSRTRGGMTCRTPAHPTPRTTASPPTPHEA